MKKNIIIVIVLGILVGYLFGNVIYKNYEGIEYQEDDGNIYYVQYGVYTSNEAALENVKGLDSYVIKELDDKFYVYLGVTTNYATALKIQNIYKDKNVYTYIRSDYVTNSETLNRLKEFDLKLEQTEKEEDIEAVVKEIFENKELNL